MANKLPILIAVVSGKPKDREKAEAYNNGPTSSHRDAIRSALRKSLRYTRGPNLYRVSGFGATVVGRFQHNAVNPAFFSMCWVTALYIPLVPIGIYLVDAEKTNLWRLFGRISFRDFARIFPGGLAQILQSSLREAAGLEARAEPLAPL